MVLNRKSLAGLSLLLAILACNTPVEQVLPPNEIQTAAALTLQVIFTPSAAPTKLTAAVTHTAQPLITQTSTDRKSTRLNSSH